MWIRIMEPAGAMTVQHVDASGQTTQVDLPDGTKQFYVNGKVARVEQPDHTKLTYIYNAAGDLAAIQITDPAGQVTVQNVDASGQTTSVVLPDGSRQYYDGGKVTRVEQ